MIKVIDGGFSHVSKHINSYIEDHPLWTSQFLRTQPQAVIDTHKDYIRGRRTGVLSAGHRFGRIGKNEDEYRNKTLSNMTPVFIDMESTFNEVPWMYFPTGADIITTNTYQASIPGFQKYLYLSEQESKQLIKKAVAFAKQAINEVNEVSGQAKNVKVAGSLGPYGACLHNGSEYTGDYIESMTEEELFNWHKPRFEALNEGGIDLFAIETVPALTEALVFCDLLKEYPDKKAWISFSCKDEKHTAHGESFRRAVEACWFKSSDQLVAVGMNCLSPVLVSPLIRSLGTHDIPIISYPNSGETWDHDLGWQNQDRMNPITDFLPEWISLGIKYVGGCCRTSPDDIKAIREYIDSLN